MKTPATDKNVLQTILPEHMTACLAGKGAVRVGDCDGKADIWSYSGEELLVPKSVTFGDYALRVADVVATLARVEGSSRGLIVAELRHADCDRIRVECRPSVTEPATLGLVANTAFLSGVLDMTGAAAVAAASRVSPRPRDGRRLADAFLETVRYVQDEEGVAYLFVPPAPKAPAKDAPRATDAAEAANAAGLSLFAGSVVPALCAGLERLVALAEDDTGEHSEDARAPCPDESFGSLCRILREALSGMLSRTLARSLEVAVSWSPTRVDRRPATHARFDRDSLRRLAARLGPTGKPS